VNALANCQIPIASGVSTNLKENNIMFTKLFSKKNNEYKTGIFEISDGNLVQLDETPGNGSIISIIEYLGYATNLVHIVHIFDSKNIECLGFKVLSEKLVFALAKNEK
jgi:hypothetical protein